MVAEKQRGLDLALAKIQELRERPHRPVAAPPTPEPAKVPTPTQQEAALAEMQRLGRWAMTGAVPPFPKGEPPAPPACECRVPGPGNGNSRCRAPMRAVCQCECHAAGAEATPTTKAE